MNCLHLWFINYTTLSAAQAVLRVTATPGDMVHLQKLILPQLIKTFTACYGAPSFITVFTADRLRKTPWP